VNEVSEEKDILILGLGNDCLGDDAVGPLVVRQLRHRMEENGSDIDLVEAGAGGMILMDLMAGYKGLILIDAIQTGSGEPGRIYRLTEDQLPVASPEHPAPPWSAHHLGLRQILETGRQAGCELPRTVIVYAVETAPPREWHRGCSPAVERAIEEIVSRVIREIPVVRADVSQRRGSP